MRYWRNEPCFSCDRGGERREDMIDKELRRLSRRELLQMLVAQCEETERLQQEADETRERLEVLEESYERLKGKLNVKDERLNQKDEKIRELKGVIEEMKASREIELEEAGSIAEAALRLNGIFEAAQEAADQYLMNVKRLVNAEHKPTGESIRPAEPVRSEKTTVLREIRMSAGATVIPIPADDRKKTLKYGWAQDARRKLLHG